MMKCSPRLDEDLSYLSYSGAVLLGPFYLDAKSLVHQMDFEKKLVERSSEIKLVNH